MIMIANVKHSIIRISYFGNMFRVEKIVLCAFTA